MIDVTCAILVEGKTILVTQRGPGMSLPGKWEFPGGKVESGEDPESCLRREIREELAVEIRVLERMGDQVWQYPEFTIRLIPFVCSILGGELKLAEHQASLWLGKEELLQLDWAPADVPVLDAFLRQAGW